ncbi:hypothetical protein [Burkholderia cenocepacia]|uniref:hypothetical protein n=1 Tax=Burkholderia cenocepacia TaxID=95486 RepID=UPI002653EF79|nr:hypothetical protein [Burkholderia cenocepacia]MDN7658485.1 hypothetical protein [Burkholderia cenocepacia]
MTEREEFEAYSARELQFSNFEAEEDGSYLLPRIQFAWEVWQASRRTTPDREAIVEEIAEMVDHMGEGRRLEEYVGAIREMKGGKS